MVARTPPKQQRNMVVVAAAPLSPTLLRETVKKVDKCVARLQELQHTVEGVTKLSSSPINSSRSYLRTSLRCKNESSRMKNANSRRSPTGKLPQITEEWRKMSLPAMLLGETMTEILQATQFARNIVDATKPATDDPKTPITEKRRKQKQNLENSGLQARRMREIKAVLQTIRSESDMPSLRRAKSRINFKVSPVVQNRECDKENCRYIANKVSPKNNIRPWAKKTVLFPNPLFHSSPTSRYEKFCKTKSPVIPRNRQTPHKFLIKSPSRHCTSKFQVKIKSPLVSISPTKRVTVMSKKSPKASLSAAAKLRRSFSPSRLANRLMSPMKSRKSAQKKNEGVKIMSGMKQRPTTTSFSIRFSPRRI